MKISNKQNFSLPSLCDSDIIKKYVGNRRLNKENIRGVFNTLLEIEDLTNMSDYPALAQKDVTLRWTEKRKYWIPVRKKEETN